MPCCLGGFLLVAGNDFGWLRDRAVADPRIAGERECQDNVDWRFDNSGCCGHFAICHPLPRFVLVDQLPALI